MTEPRVRKEHASQAPGGFGVGTMPDKEEVTDSAESGNVVGNVKVTALC